MWWSKFLYIFFLFFSTSLLLSCKWPLPTTGLIRYDGSHIQQIMKMFILQDKIASLSFFIYNSLMHTALDMCIWDDICNILCSWMWMWQFTKYTFCGYSTHMHTHSVYGGGREHKKRPRHYASNNKRLKFSDLNGSAISMPQNSNYIKAKLLIPSYPPQPQNCYLAWSSVLSLLICHRCEWPSSPR